MEMQGLKMQGLTLRLHKIAQQQVWLQRRFTSACVVGFITFMALFLQSGYSLSWMSIPQFLLYAFVGVIALLVMAVGHFLVTLLPALFMDQIFQQQRWQRICGYLLILGVICVLLAALMGRVSASGPLQMLLLLKVATWALLFWGTEALIELVPFSVIQAKPAD